MKLLAVLLLALALGGCAEVVVGVIFGGVSFYQRHQHQQALEAIRQEIAALRPIQAVRGPEQVFEIPCPGTVIEILGRVVFIGGYHAGPCVMAWDWP